MGCVSTVASQMLSILISLLSTFTHLGTAETRMWAGEWQLDVSIPTLKALGVSSLPITQFEGDRALDKLMSSSPHLQTFITLGEGEGDKPSLPSVKNLHLRSRESLFDFWKAADACNGNVLTFSYTSFQSGQPRYINYLNQPTIHATLESMYIDIRNSPWFFTWKGCIA
jgi:hypothetical protein